MLLEVPVCKHSYLGVYVSLFSRNLACCLGEFGWVEYGLSKVCLRDPTLEREREEKERKRERERARQSSV